MRNFLRVLVLTFGLSAMFSLSGNLYGQNQDVFRIKEGVMRLNPASGTPAEIRLPSDANLSAAEFINGYSRVFNLSADNQLEIFETFSDQLGQTHYRIKQTYKGVDLFGIQYLVHEKNGSVFLAHGKLIHDLDLDISPSVSREVALGLALQHIGADEYMWDDPEAEKFIKKHLKDPNATFFPTGELLLTNHYMGLIGTDFRLVWRFNIYSRSPSADVDVFLDAGNGNVVNVIDRMESSDVPGIGTTLYNGPVSMTTDSVSTGNYRLREAARGGGIVTLDLQNADMDSFHLAVDFQDDDNDFSDPHDQAGVSVHWAMEGTYDYYLNEHSRNSFDNLGGVITSYAHAGNGWFNAQWLSSLLAMRFGDGPGNNAPLVSIDVAAHEFTHGVDQFSSNLIYQAESGALDESFADIFGTLVEFYLEGPGADWLIGEDFGAIRSMSDPGSFGDPDTYFGSNWAPLTGGDNGGVHSNSGVQNFWFYLLSEGGSGTNDNGDVYNVTGIGKDDAADISYRSRTTYLMSSSGYFDARFGAIQSAVDLYGPGSQQHQSVIDAWEAVGVYVPYVDPRIGVLDTVDFVAELSVASDTVTIVAINTGFDTLEIAGIQISGTHFQEISGQGFPVSLNQYKDEMSVTLVFTPTIEGLQIDSLTFFSNDTTAPAKSVILRAYGYVVNPATASVMYAVTGPNANSASLTIDPNTGAGSALGNSTFLELRGLSIEPSSKELFATARIEEGISTVEMLVRINAPDGRAFPVVEIPLAEVEDIAFDSNGDLYCAVLDGDLYKLDPQTGAATYVASTGIAKLYGISFNPVDGQLWGINLQQRKLFKIDKLSGATVEVGATGFSNMRGMGFDAAGRLYAISGSSTSDSKLILVDTTSGGGTLVGTIGFPSVNSVAIDGPVILGLGDEPVTAIPRDFELHQNYPNPFNPTTLVRYDLPNDASVKLEIYNMLGQRVKTLLNASQTAGYKSISWNGTNDHGESVASGVYLLRINADGFVRSRKLMFLK